MSEHGKITPNAPTIPLNDLSILDAGALLRAGTISAKDLAKDALARIGALDDKLNSFITRMPILQTESTKGQCRTFPMP